MSAQSDYFLWDFLNVTIQKKNNKIAAFVNWETSIACEPQMGFSPYTGASTYTHTCGGYVNVPAYHVCVYQTLPESPYRMCLVLCINMCVDNRCLVVCSCVMRCAQCASERRCARCWLLCRHTGDLLLQQRLPAFLQRADDHSLPARRHLEQPQQDTPMHRWVEAEDGLRRSGVTTRSHSPVVPC